MENPFNNPINFISSKDTEEELEMCLDSDNIKFKSYNDANEVVNVKLLCSKYQENLDTSMKVSNFISDSVQFVVVQILILLTG